MKNNGWKRTEEHKISVEDLVKKILWSWKFILCCMLVGAAVFGGYKYCKSLGADMEQDAVQPEQQIISEEALTEIEREAVEYAQSLKFLLDGQKAYMEESALMKIDPYEESQIVLLYEISDGGGGTARKILEQYFTYVENGGAVSDILEDGNFDISAQYLQELIRTDRMESDYDVFDNRPYFSVIIIEDDMEMAEKLADAAENVLEAYGRQIVTAPEQSVKLLTRQKAIVYDAGLEEMKNTLFFSRNDQVNLLNTITSQFSEGQKKAYYQSNYEAELETPAADGKGLTGMAGSILIYVLAGMVIGAFLGCCWIICCFFLSDKIKSTAELERNYDLCVYGTIKKNGKNGCGNLQASKQLLARMVLSCHKNNIGKLVFASGHELLEPIEKEIQLFYKELEKQGIKSITAENILEKVEVYEQIQDTDAVVILLEAEKTAYAMLDKMLSFLAENNISLSGVIVIEG